MSFSMRTFALMPSSASSFCDSRDDSTASEYCPREFGVAARNVVSVAAWEALGYAEAKEPGGACVLYDSALSGRAGATLLYGFGV